MSQRTRRGARHASGMFDEIVVDNFAGGGGASMGIERALGRAVDASINHDPEAVAMHRANHPATEHYCEDVWTVDPHDVARGRKIGLAWFSPDCCHFSRARGAKPVKKSIRGLAWVVVRWAAKVRPRVIMLENVREFETWGPVVPLLGEDGAPLLWPDGSPKMVPCKRRAGITFKRWTSTLRNLGYAVEWRTLDAADYGAPTHRRRLFLIARRDGEPIRWPEPTHGPGRGTPYRTAAECIDWSLPCPSIFLTREEGRRLGVNRPLAEKTMRRIAMGLKRFVLDNPKPFIVQVNHGGDDFRGQPARRPLSTISSKHGYGVVTPYLTAQFGEAPGQDPRAHRADAPAPTITPRDGGGFPLVAPYLARICQNGSNGSNVGSVARPLTTLVSKNEHCLVAPSLVQYNQEKGSEVRGKPLTEPINTVTGDNRFALASAFIVKHFGGVTGHVPGRPLGTVTAVDHHGVVSAFLGTHYGDRPDGSVREGSPLGVPHPTVTADGNHSVLTAANLVHMNHGAKQWSDVDDPLRTILGGANHHGLVRAFLSKYYGRSTGQDADAPLDTISSRDRFGVVRVEGEEYLIADIGLRMLTPRELFACQGFPPDYVIDVQVGTKRLPKYVQTRMVGNSVPPDVAEALVRANFPEECAAPVPAKRTRRRAAGVAS